MPTVCVLPTDGGPRVPLASSSSASLDQKQQATIRRDLLRTLRKVCANLRGMQPTPAFRAIYRSVERMLEREERAAKPSAGRPKKSAKRS